MPLGQRDLGLPRNRRFAESTQDLSDGFPNPLHEIAWVVVQRDGPVPIPDALELEAGAQREVLLVLGKDPVESGPVVSARVPDVAEPLPKRRVLDFGAGVAAEGHVV